VHAALDASEQQLGVPPQWVIAPPSATGAPASADAFVSVAEPYRAMLKAWEPSRGKTIASMVTDVKTQGSGCESMHLGAQDALVSMHQRVWLSDPSKLMYCL
jgi:hypothetical protein